jgi:hypothetical protein
MRKDREEIEDAKNVESGKNGIIWFIEKILSIIWLLEKCFFVFVALLLLAVFAMILGCPVPDFLHHLFMFLAGSSHPVKWE